MPALGSISAVMILTVVDLPNRWDRHQVPAGEGKRAEQEHEEGAGDGQDAEGLNDSGFGLALRRERLGIEEAAEKVTYQGAENAGRPRAVLRFHKGLDTGEGE